MEYLLTPSNITFVIGLLGVVFSIYNYFRNPQIAFERREVGVRGQLDLIKQDLQNLKDNHIHTIENKVTSLESSILVMSGKLIELSTIIDERIPKNKQ